MTTPADSVRWRTRANGLTALRLAAAPALALAIHSGAAWPAAALFVLAVATDLLDGPVARRFGESSAFGARFDHATDATFVSAGLAALALRGEVPALLPALVVLAFVQYLVDSRWLAPAAPLGASSLGRINGIAYFVPVGTAVGRDALGLAWPPAAWLLALGWLLVATTLASMASRALALRQVLRGR